MVIVNYAHSEDIYPALEIPSPTPLVYVEAKFVPIVPKLILEGILSPELENSCVALAKAVTGYSGVIGYAYNWPINTMEPAVGEVVVLQEGKFGHVAIIIDIKDNSLLLYESNYIPGKITDNREISIHSPDIVGYWRK